jgi:hypothetical protein
MVEKKVKRIYSKDMEFPSDLFKLEIANMLKNAGFDDKKPVLQNVEHCHFYRTYNSNGKKLTQCNFVGGHTHEVTVDVKADGTLVAKCGKAYGSKFNDEHTHKTSYVRSDVIAKRKLNEGAQAEISRLGAI